MYDSYGRKINYLRVSVTDRCNFRCFYCMPEKGIENKLAHGEIMSLEETYEIIKEFVELGVDKIRLTGGEPLIRKGIVDLIRKINLLEGVREIALTTNAYLLEDMAEELKAAGLTRVNISLDTLNEEKFKEITRGGDLQKVLNGIKKAEEVGLTPIKINAVLIGGFNDDEIEDLVGLTKRGIDVRFIELMPIGEAADFAEEKFISNDEVLKRVKDLEKVESGDKSSPAVYYRLGDNKGKVGIINPISCKFCDNCNRVRLTSTGMLKTCLHSNREINLKEALEKNMDLKEIIEKSISEKEESHHIEDKEYIDRNMNEIGG